MSRTHIDVLIVDDHEGQRRQLCGMLEDEGHRVAEAGDAAAALSTVQRRRFDAVALDVNMPGTDGLTAMLRLHELDPDLAVVIVTGETLIQRAREFVLKQGAFDLLAKPPDPEHLVAVLEEAARLTRHW